MTNSNARGRVNQNIAREGGNRVIAVHRVCCSPLPVNQWLWQEGGTMLPSSGYFRGIVCPGQLRGACNRPYCHFRHDMKVSTEKNTSPSASSSQAAVPTPVQEEADAVEEEKLEEIEHQIMSKEVSECSSASLAPAVTTPSEPEEQQSQPHTSQQQESVTASGEVPKSEILQQLMSEALKKVLAENPTLASTVDASSIRIGIDPVTQESPEVNKTKKQLYHRPPDTPNYNPTPIRELKKRKQSVDGVHNLVYNPTCSRTTGDKGSGDEGDVMGEFSSDESEEVEEKNDDFDLLEEVLAEHSKNNKVKVKKKKVKELGKLQYSLSNTHKTTVDNSIMITDAKKLSDKEVKKYELPQTESVNKIITDGPYFLPPSPIFTSSSDGFEAFSARAARQEEEPSVPEECVDKAPPLAESVKTNTQPATEKKMTPKQTTEQPKPSSQPENAEKVTKASGHTHLPQLLSARGAPKLSRPNVRTWTPLVRNNIPSSETQKTTDQLDEILQLMDGSDPSNKRKLKENEHQTSNQRDSENARPKKKYKVDLNKEIESLSNPALEHSKESVTPEEPAKQQPEPTNNQDSDKKQSTKEESVSDERDATKKASPKESEEKKQTDESEAASVESEDSESNTLSEESGNDSEFKQSRHRKKRKRKRSHSSSSGSDYSHHRRKKRKRSRKRHHKRSKRSRRRRDSTSSQSDQSQESEEEREEKKNDDEEEEENYDTEEEEENEEEDKENKSKEDSESEDEDSNDDIEHTRKSKRHRKKHKYYKKLKHRRNKHKARRKRKRSKSYSRSRSTGKSRDSSRSRSRSGSQSRSSSKHRKKRNRSRHKSRNYSDSDNRDSSKENSRSRSSSRSSSKHKRRGSREDDSSGSRHRESSKSKDKRVDEESNKSRKEDRRERSSSKVDQQTSDDKKSKNHNDEEISIPMPVDPSKIKVEKNALVPDLSKVKIEKEDPLSEKSNGQVSVNAKSKESSCKGQSESSQSKVAEKFPEQRRPSSEDKNRRKKSHERKDSTESTSDKAPHRRQSCDSKASDNEGSMQRKKTEERRSSTEKIKRSQSISSQPSEMSMFDLVLASAETSKPAKTLTEISMFDSMAKTSTNHSLEASGTKNKSKDASHKGSGENAVSSEHKSSSSDKTSKSSRPDKTAHTDSHHKHTKSDSKTSHSTSKSKSSSSSSSSSHHSSSSHKRTSSTSSRSSTSKHHSTSIATTTTATTTTTTTATTTTPSSSSKTPDGSSSSKNRKSSDPSSSKSEKESSRHSSTSSRKHSSSSNKHHDSSTSRRSSSSSRHKDSKESTTETAKNNMGSEITKKRRVSADEESQGGVSDHDQPSSGVDSPLPDLSMLDEISQDDWEQMISGMDGANQEPSEETEGDDVDTDNPWVLEECMKMFNEFQPEENHLENQVLPKKMKAAVGDKEPPKSSSKQRVARSSTGNLMAKKTSRSHHQKTSPMQMMVERYQRLKEQLKMKEKQLHHLQGGPSSVTSSSSSKTSVLAPSSSSSSYHSPSSQGSGKSKKRIAHVPNVNSLLSAQEKIKKQTHSSISSRISPKVARASGVIPETTAHTVAKGGKRIAHTPKIGALAKPIIQPELGSLVPQNIRQRYLNALIEECKKFTSEKESFNIAAAEERVCYKRAPSRMVYLNLVVNAVKRLRTQQQAGEEAQELLDKDPQLAEKMCIEEPSPSTTKPSPPVSSPSSSRSHPINPNHVQLSHTSVLSSGGIRGSWSIEKPKKSSASQEDIKGNAFYKNLTKYILTEEQLEENGYPCPDPEEKGKAIVKKIDSRKKISPSALERYCDRCSVLYTVDKWGFPKNSAPCVYHWGRAYKKRKYGTFETSYSCCGGEQGSGGCSQATTHVSENYNPKNLRGYVRTISKDSSSSNKEVYALDCEMCYTTEGNELTRITVINSSGDVVYEQLVKPENPILDYNTRFSGITENDMEDVKLTIRDVQAALLARFSDKTILIGHSLESDLHALKIIHTTVVDTSVVFPHKMGAPYKRALKNLAAEYLKRIIQDDVSGHDSAEDAIACLHLMQWKVKEDLKGFSK
ncbi:serine-rich adhesin for platelets-like isoform X2 [Scylla paramamosain]|uniref:serine-rich adhesin for platelets-like isoform X2 n=1 Tax=Scylla paramamosain TaxID=85552 RepID=UPI0030834E1C